MSVVWTKLQIIYLHGRSFTYDIIVAVLSIGMKVMYIPIRIMPICGSMKMKNFMSWISNLKDHGNGYKDDKLSNMTRLP